MTVHIVDYLDTSAAKRTSPLGISLYRKISLRLIFGTIMFKRYLLKTLVTMGNSTSSEAVSSSFLPIKSATFLLRERRSLINLNHNSKDICCFQTLLYSTLSHRQIYIYSITASYLPRLRILDRLANPTPGKQLEGKRQKTLSTSLSNRGEIL